jgi:4-oxalocrotonate tautomerase
LYFGSTYLRLFDTGDEVRREGHNIFEEGKMPIVRVDFWEGVGKDKVKTMIRGITNVMMDLGVPEHAVEVIVYEIPKTHWGISGEPASEKLKDVQPPK